MNERVVLSACRIICVFLIKYQDIWHRYKDLNQALSDKDDLEFTLKRTVLERDHLKCDLENVTKERDDLEPQLHELRDKVRGLSNVEAENSSLELQVSNLTNTLKERVTVTSWDLMVACSQHLFAGF